MSKVRKFSLLYDPAEDRLAWDAEGVDGAVIRIWLTRRFCRDFVLALIERLPRSAADTVAPEHEATVQGWEQAAAMSGFGKTPGVRATPQTESALVRAVHITPGAHGVSLAFEFGHGEQRSVDLDGAAVRQMLSVMHDLHVAAGWPVDFWPPWIKSAPTGEGAAALN